MEIARQVITELSRSYNKLLDTWDELESDPEISGDDKAALGEAFKTTADLFLSTIENWRKIS